MKSCLFARMKKESDSVGLTASIRLMPENYI